MNATLSHNKSHEGLEHVNQISTNLFPFQIEIKGNATFINQTVGPDQRDLTLSVWSNNSSGKNQEQLTVQISAKNQMGPGPKSGSVRVAEYQPSVVYNNSLPSSYDSDNNRATITWIIAIVGSLSFVLITLSGVIFYKRKWSARNKPGGYLAASTSDDFHCHLQNCTGPILRAADPSKDPSLWIDRRWNTADYEKDSNSSEKKLLSGHFPQNSNSNSDTEYAYVDRHNVSSFTNRSSGSENRKQASRKNAESPEPYATTDILRKDNLRFSGRHYAAPFQAASSQRRDIQSCDDLTERPRVHGQQQQQHHQQQQQQQPQQQNIYNVYSSQHGSKHSGNKSKKPKNLLDILPPPPVHPPPPPAIAYGLSQESVISPKYLFSHPVYQSTNRQFNQPQVQGNKYYRVCPVDQRHYEKPINESGFRRVLCPPQGSKAPAQFVKDLDRDFQNELQSFNDVVTQMSEGKPVYSTRNAAAVVNDAHDDSYCVSSGDSSCYELSKSMSDNEEEVDDVEEIAQSRAFASSKQ